MILFELFILEITVVNTIFGSFVSIWLRNNYSFIRVYNVYIFYISISDLNTYYNSICSRNPIDLISFQYFNTVWSLRNKKIKVRIKID